MTQEKYIEQGFERIYTVSDPGENLDGTYHVLECDMSRPERELVTKEHTFGTLAEAQGFTQVRQAEMDEWELEPDENALAEHEASEMNAIAARYSRHGEV